MVNQPVLNHEWDFSLGAEREHDEGACRQGWGRQGGPVNPHRASKNSIHQLIGQGDGGQLQSPLVQPNASRGLVWAEMRGLERGRWEGKSRDRACW